MNDTVGLGQSGRRADDVRAEHQVIRSQGVLEAAEHERTLEVLEHVFKYHAPRGIDVAKYHTLRKAAHEFAVAVAEVCPPSADRTVAFRAIREAVSWANASIALDGIAPR